MRCGWVPEGHALYEQYHDDEWGVPVKDDQTLFEFLVLESAQAGLSWRTILERREGYRQVFDAFDVEQVAQYNEEAILTRSKDARIVRNLAKIRAAVCNAKIFLSIQKEHGCFASYLWAFVEGTPIQNAWERIDQVPAQTAISDDLAKDLKARGMKFIGTTIMYAYMQAVGLVNDHLVSCDCYARLREQGKMFYL